MNAVLPVSPGEPRLARFTASDFRGMIAAGALARHPRAELRDGVIIEMAPEYSDHGHAKGNVYFELRLALRRHDASLDVLSEVTLFIDESTMPTPDISVFESFEGNGPIPGAAVKLLVEVSVSTLADDLGAKRALYARARVPEYWVVDVAARAVHQFADPDADAATYRAVQLTAFTQPIASLTMPELVLPASTFG